MTQEGQPRLLCVDDEPAVLEMFQLHLRRAFQVVTAGDGATALRLIEEGPPFAVILSDMRMPTMNGATFLARARALSPDSVRLLLTGHAEIESAMAAVNEGRIFRFLTKPCPPDTLRATLEQAAEQHRLVVSERVLLDQTLTGAVKALTDLLAITAPGAFGRAARLRRTVSALCQELGVAERWAVEVAADLSQVWLVPLSPALADKVLEGAALLPAEQGQVERALRLGDQVLANIPRLEPVRAILAALAPGRGGVAHRAPPAGAPHGVALLALAQEFEALESGGMQPVEALAAIEARFVHPPRLVEALVAAVASWTASTVREVQLEEVRAGMVLAEDVRSRSGLLLVARGHAMSPGMLVRLHNIAASVREPLRVVVAEPQRAAAGLTGGGLQVPPTSSGVGP